MPKIEGDLVYIFPEYDSFIEMKLPKWSLRCNKFCLIELGLHLGATWSGNIQGGVAGKCEELPCHGVRFLKMIHYPFPEQRILKQCPVL